MPRKVIPFSFRSLLLFSMHINIWNVSLPLWIDLSVRMEDSKAAIQTHYKLQNEIQLLEWQIKQVGCYRL
jgi:hypothetical protein